MKESRIARITNAIRSVVCPETIVEMHRTIIGWEKDRGMKEKCASCPHKHPDKKEKNPEAENDLWIPEPEPPMSELERSAAVFSLSNKYNIEESYIRWWLKFYEARLRVRYTKVVVNLNLLTTFPGQFVEFRVKDQYVYGYIISQQRYWDSILVREFSGQKYGYSLASSCLSNCWLFERDSEQPGCVSYISQYPQEAEITGIEYLSPETGTLALAHRSSMLNFIDHLIQPEEFPLSVEFFNYYSIKR